MSKFEQILKRIDELETQTKFLEDIEINKLLIAFYLDSVKAMQDSDSDDELGVAMLGLISSTTRKLKDFA